MAGAVAFIRYAKNVFAQVEITARVGSGGRQIVKVVSVVGVNCVARQAGRHVASLANSLSTRLQAKRVSQPINLPPHPPSHVVCVCTTCHCRWPDLPLRLHGESTHLCRLFFFLCFFSLLLLLLSPPFTTITFTWTCAHITHTQRSTRSRAADVNELQLSLNWFVFLFPFPDLHFTLAAKQTVLGVNENWHHLLISYYIYTHSFLYMPNSIHLENQY